MLDHKNTDSPIKTPRVKILFGLSTKDNTQAEEREYSRIQKLLLK